MLKTLYSALTAALLLAGCKESPDTPAPTNTEITVPAATAAERAAVDQQSADMQKLIEMMNDPKVSATQKDYADGRLAALIETSTDLAAVTAAKQSLPIGTSSKLTAFNQEARLKNRKK